MSTIKIPIYWINFLRDPSIRVLKLGALQRDRLEKIRRKKMELETLQLEYQRQEEDLHGLVSGAHTEEEIDWANAEFNRFIKP
jgi:hypothetical protein